MRRLCVLTLSAGILAAVLVGCTPTGASPPPPPGGGGGGSRPQVSVDWGTFGNYVDLDSAQFQPKTVQDPHTGVVTTLMALVFTGRARHGMWQPYFRAQFLAASDGLVLAEQPVFLDNVSYRLEADERVRGWLAIPSGIEGVGSIRLVEGARP
jgi:hypothetical protein